MCNSSFIARAQIAGRSEPRNRRLIYDNKEAARGFERHPCNGQEPDATAIRDYFAPLQAWLDEQNKGKPWVGERIT